MSDWFVWLSGVLCVITVVHVIHAMSAAWWVFRWGEEWHRDYRTHEASGKHSRDEDARERVRLYDKHHGANWLRFLGVKSYRLEKWALDASRPRRWALKLARLGWRWNFFAPGVSLLVLGISISDRSVPPLARDFLWITVMAIVIGMATIAIEGLVATITFGSWAEYHHGWRRRTIISASPVSINGIAIWLGCVLLSWVAGAALIAVSALQFHAFGGFPYSDSWIGQLWAASTVSLPWTVQGAPALRAVDPLGAAAVFAIPAVYFGYVVVFLPAVFTGSDASRGTGRSTQGNEGG